MSEYLSRTEERLRALAERGWRPHVETHLVPRRAAEAHGLPGPWVPFDETHFLGFMIYMRPGPALARRTAVSRRGGVYSTLDPCLDEAERFADQQWERVEAL